MDIWQFISESIDRVALLYVTDSKGSSPGRKGFRMAVRSCGKMHGSIGGGIMEQKMVTWAIQRLQSSDCQPVLRRQIHREGQGSDYSGLICSGEQTIAFVTIEPGSFLAEGDGFVTLSANGVSFSKSEPKQNGQWAVFPLFGAATAYIIGGGHVGLALSKTMAGLGFRVEVFDDRSNLNTIDQNQFADEKHIGNLDEIITKIPEGDQSYVIAVTFGLGVDRQVLAVLKDKQFRYFGLMGSRSKIMVLEQEFGSLAPIFAPAGLAIASQTPAEIAVSIAAQIIQVKNTDSIVLND